MKYFFPVVLVPSTAAGYCHTTHLVSYSFTTLTPLIYCHLPLSCHVSRACALEWKSGILFRKLREAALHVYHFVSQETSDGAPAACAKIQRDGSCCLLSNSSCKVFHWEITLFLFVINNLFCGEVFWDCVYVLF